MAGDIDINPANDPLARLEKAAKRSSETGLSISFEIICFIGRACISEHK